MSQIKTIKQLMHEMKAYKSRPQMVGNWRDYIPKGSRWQPGDPGDPKCMICEGTGYLRVDLPLSHPDFGRLFLCECAKTKVAEAERVF
jgi:hypothetical protein